MAIHTVLRETVDLLEVGQQIQRMPSGVWQCVGTICESDKRKTVRANRRNENQLTKTSRAPQGDRRVQHIKGANKDFK